MYAQIGDIVFEGLLGFSSFNLTVANKLQEMERIDDKARLQSTGMELETQTISINIHAAYADPQAIIDQIKEYVRTASIVPIIDGNGKYYGRFVIAKIGQDVQTLGPKGELIAATVNLEIKEFYDGDNDATEAIELRTKASSVSENNPTPITRLNAEPVELLETIKAVSVARSNSLDSLPLVDQAVAAPAQKDSFLLQVKNKMDQAVSSFESAKENIQNNPKYGQRSSTLESDLIAALDNAKELKTAAEASNLDSSIQASKNISSSLGKLDKSMQPINILSILRKKL